MLVIIKKFMKIEQSSTLIRNKMQKRSKRGRNQLTKRWFRRIYHRQELKRKLFQKGPGLITKKKKGNMFWQAVMVWVSGYTNKKHHKMQFQQELHQLRQLKENFHQLNQCLRKYQMVQVIIRCLILMNELNHH